MDNAGAEIEWVNRRLILLHTAYVYWLGESASSDNAQRVAYCQHKMNLIVNLAADLLLSLDDVYQQMIGM